MRQIHYHGEGTDEYPEWGMKHGYTTRTGNGTLMLHRFNKDPIVLQIVDRLGQKIYPDPEATDKSQAKIDEMIQDVTDDRLAGYKTRRLLDGISDDILREGQQPGDCEHGLPPAICTEGCADLINGKWGIYD